MTEREDCIYWSGPCETCPRFIKGTCPYDDEEDPFIDDEDLDEDFLE